MLLQWFCCCCSVVVSSRGVCVCCLLCCDKTIHLYLYIIYIILSLFILKINIFTHTHGARGCGLDDDSRIDAVGGIQITTRPGAQCPRSPASARPRRHHQRRASKSGEWLGGVEGKTFSQSLEFSFG